MNELIKVAKIGKTYGLKGYLKLYNLSDFPSQFKKNAEFFLAKDKLIKIKEIQKDCVLFEGYENLEKAKELVNLSLFQSIENTRKNCKLKKDEFFYFDIIGCVVKDETQKLGVVFDILETGSGFLFELKTDEKLVSHSFATNFFVPYLDKFVQKIDIQKREILCTNEAFLILENS